MVRLKEVIGRITNGFYSTRRFYSIEDANKQLQSYLREYNNFPMQPLDWKSPIEVLRDLF